MQTRRSRFDGQATSTRLSAPVEDVTERLKVRTSWSYVCNGIRDERMTRDGDRGHEGLTRSDLREFRRS